MSDLFFPRPEAWALTQDQLLGGQLSSDIRPASEVAQDLYRKATALWRADRRGRTSMEELSAQIHIQADALEQAQLASQSLEAMILKREQIEDRLGALRKEQISAQKQMDGLIAQREQVSRTDQARKLLEQAGDISPFADLPKDIEGELSRLASLQRSLAQEVGKTGQALAQANEQSDRFTFREERLLEKEEDISRLYAQLSSLKEGLEKLPQLQKTSQIAAQIAAHFISDQLCDPYQQKELRDISLSSLKDTSAQALDAHLALLRAREQLSNGAGADPHATADHFADRRLFGSLRCDHFMPFSKIYSPG